MNIYLKDDNILNIYIHGSKVYETSNKNSDTDYILVVKNQNEPIKQETYNGDDFTIYRQDTWELMANNNHIDFIESIYAPTRFKIKETYVPQWQLNSEKIRRQFSKTASNSWSKAFKKLKDSDDFNDYIGRKSLFHSLRILDFGCQILEKNKIIYNSMNHYYTDILDSNNSIDDLKRKYQPIRNELKQKFKQLQPVEHEPMTIYTCTLNVYTKTEHDMITFLKDIDFNIGYIKTNTDEQPIKDLNLVVPGNTVKYKQQCEMFTSIIDITIQEYIKR